MENYVRQGNGSGSDTIVDIGGQATTNAVNDALALAIALG